MTRQEAIESYRKLRRVSRKIKRGGAAKEKWSEVKKSTAGREDPAAQVRARQAAGSYKQQVISRSKGLY
jgi:hypothetical protein